MATTTHQQRLIELQTEVERKRQVLARLLASKTSGGGSMDINNNTAIQAPRAASRRALLDIPSDIANNPDLDAAIATALPVNYNFEVKKTLWRIRKSGAKRIALQLPEGLLIFACPLADLFTTFAGQEIDVVVMGDVTYGACCVDDYGAKALGVTLLIHYGHSCLVPIDITKNECGVEIMYVFVDISFDATHAVECIKMEFEASNTLRPLRLALMGTIQFSGGALHQAKKLLEQAGFWVTVPQEKPLSGGEVLGCTAPTLPYVESDSHNGGDGGVDCLVFVSDGRFHLESAMIANPHIPAYRYDPYGKTLTRENYDHEKMMQDRLNAVSMAKHAKRWGVILGTLGRQGNVRVLERVVKWLKQREMDHFTVLLSELSPAKLMALQTEAKVEAWIQIACPRLSVDWSRAFSVPLLTTYEACVALGFQEWKQVYPQDFYSKQGGPWSNYYSVKE